LPAHGECDGWGNAQETVAGRTGGVAHAAQILESVQLRNTGLWNADLPQETDLRTMHAWVPLSILRWQRRTSERRPSKQVAQLARRRSLSCEQSGSTSEMPALLVLVEIPSHCAASLRPSSARLSHFSSGAYQRDLANTTR